MVTFTSLRPTTNLPVLSSATVTISWVLASRMRLETLALPEAGVKRKVPPLMDAPLNTADSRGLAAAGVKEPRLPGALSEIAGGRCFAGLTDAAIAGANARAHAADARDRWWTG